MVAIGRNNPLAFLIEPGIEWFPVADSCPGTALDVKIDTKLIGCIECRFGWTPGVEADVVQTVGFADLEYPLPFRDVCRRVACLWKDGTFECTA